MSDTVMLITGASSGIGEAVARQAVARGWKVAMLARSAKKLEALEKELGAQVLGLSADVSSEDDLKSALAAVKEKWGRLDVVFANAGTGGSPGGFSGADPDGWKSMLMTNVYGLALTLQVTSEAIRESRGHVVITGSIAGRRSLPGSMYSASKWAVTGIGHGFRKEVGKHGVRVTLIEPGMVDTAFFDEPKPDMLKSEDVARAVMYALDQPSHMEVHELVVLPMAQQGSDIVP
ncbi:SDR family oxidoreductase [Oleiagrimonas sp. C23AA]|uniref:SDR family oxidoreductase n=1 Tax=Oleiagrimonas sp. C23AA TaxID=2719047 RepID=UPI00141FE609|nr:SDR family oxidoreductase [Oleiagrimonas sp. C23AA]NII12170.1 SDR family oxidoreductase [Oleiagrimonas sp. C23AA]